MAYINLCFDEYKLGRPTERSMWEFCFHSHTASIMLVTVYLYWMIFLLSLIEFYGCCGIFWCLEHSDLKCLIKQYLQNGDKFRC